MVCISIRPKLSSILFPFSYFRNKGFDRKPPVNIVSEYRGVECQHNTNIHMENLIANVIFVGLKKLDGVGPLDTRPSTTLSEQTNICNNMGHVICDM